MKCIKAGRLERTPLQISKTQTVVTTSQATDMSNVLFYEPFYDFERLIEEARGGSQNNQVQGQGSQMQRMRGDNRAMAVFKPRMDLHEDTKRNMVTATFEFPGIPKDKISIDVNNGRMTVMAEATQSMEHNENGYAVRERYVGKMSRTIQLPQGVKDTDIKAKMDNGVLTITFPKSTPELAPKKVMIN